MKQQRELPICPRPCGFKNRRAVSDICGRGGWGVLWGLDRGAFVRGVTPSREVLPLHSSVVDRCLLVGASFRNFISCVWVHWMRPFPPSQQETSKWLGHLKEYIKFGQGSQYPKMLLVNSYSGVIHVIYYLEETMSFQTCVLTNLKRA